MPEDCRGLETTAANAEAVAAYDRTIRAYLGFARDTGDHLKTVFKADPDMAMAHCLKGYFFLLFTNPLLDTKVDQALDAARKSAAARPVTAREAQHIEALAAWRVGDLRRATDQAANDAFPWACWFRRNRRSRRCGRSLRWPGLIGIIGIRRWRRLTRDIA